LFFEPNDNCRIAAGRLSLVSFMSFSLRAAGAGGSSKLIRGITIFLDDAQNADDTQPEVLCAA
jgi:hypothetical protein